ncbi:MAG TPA: pullulanase-associated domain-containing protein [Albitalea sp.]|uniref:pullulanase-associated domain-containing protein n=1 Tax=Piscinibacter sp. TaxID=1903157 RepID=UPI002ECFB836
MHIRIVLSALVVGIVATGPALGQSALPEGKVAINYNRCDNNYDGWGAHLWKDPGTPLPGVEWNKPMMPTGKSDFGVFWHTDLAEYGSKGKVNYIIHKGDNKEQGGQDMSFDAKATKEVWVNSGDRKIYTSLEDAQKARAATPCR